VYVEENPAMSGKTAVGIDPNMGNLLYCSTEVGDKKMRYTRNQRRQELKTDWYDDIRENEKESKIGGKSVEEWESTLSIYDHKTTLKEQFKDYVRQKLLVNSKIQPVYERRIFRKLKLSTFYNTRKSEQKFINKFKATFGPPEKVVIGMGDWCQRQHRRSHTPVKGKGFREMFRKAGYTLYLIDEFRTSARCSRCQLQEGICSEFQEDDESRKLIHALLLCQQCGRIWNRDSNASRNIARLTRCGLQGLPRPEYLSRAVASQASTTPRALTFRRRADGNWLPWLPSVISPTVEFM
jgi:transposase